MEKSIKVAVDSFIEKDGKMLLGLRKNIAGTGQWALVGGHLEFGETLQEGLRRELKEELEIEAQDMELLNITTVIQEAVEYIHFVFRIKSYAGEIRNAEPEKCERLEWFERSQMPEKIFFGHQKLLKAILKNKFFDDDAKIQG